MSLVLVVAAGLCLSAGCAGRFTTRDSTLLGPSAAPGGGPADSSRPRQVTTSLFDELSPAIDPSTDRLVYVSNRGGNRDIWARPLAGGFPERLTDHSADDFDPAVAPGGGRLAFASLRRDAKGDIYVRSEGGELHRLTNRTSADRQPTWSPDGRRLAFTSAEGNAAEAVWELTLEPRSTRRLSARPGFDPAYSPDGKFLAFTSMTAGQAEGGRRMPCLWLHRQSDGAEAPAHACARPEGFATFAREGEADWLVFSRFQDDTNGDGHWDVEDRPSLWRQRFEGWSGELPVLGPAVPLTAGVASDITPHVYAGRVYYASRVDEDLDIWVLPLAGAQPPVVDWADAERRVRAAPDPQRALFVLRRCAHDLAGTQTGLRCSLEKAERLLASGRVGQAGQAFAALATQASPGQIRARALLGQATVRMHLRLPKGLAPSEQRERLPEARALVAEIDKLEPVGGRRWLVRADILRRVGRWAQALDALDTLAEGGPEAQIGAQAELLRAEIQQVLGDGSAAEASLLKILGDYRQQRPEVIEAAGRLLRQATRGFAGKLQPDSAAAIERLESLAQRWPDLPVLPAMIRVEIGHLHRLADERELARRAYSTVERHYGDEPEMVAASLLALSEMAEEDGDLSQALDHATELLDRTGADPAQRRRARRRIQQLGSTYAEQLVVEGETGMAIKVFRQLLRQDPNDVVAHRQLIGLLAARGKATQALAEYRQRLEEHPADDLSLYLVGLCLTYIEPPSRFEQALQMIDRALALNAQAPFAHQTRGWIQEQRYHLLGDPDGLGRAAEAYQAALSLLDVRARPRAEADLLLNLGNVFYALGNHQRAFQFYRRRQAREVPFALPVRRLVFLERFGRSALLADELPDAARAFSSAAALARDLSKRDRLPRLVASQAAAAQLMGDHTRAAELFERACRLYERAGRVGRLASCRRNVGYNLSLAGDRVAALRAFLEAEALLGEHGSDAGGGSRVVSVGLGAAASRAAQGFDRRGELNFLYTFQGRLYRQAGDRDRAVRALQRKVRLLKNELASGGRSSTRLELAISLNHLGVVQYHQGQAMSAADFFARAGRQAAKAGSIEGAVVNLIDRVDVWLDAPGTASAEDLLAEVTGLERELAAGRPARPLSRARLSNAAGVLRVASADALLAGPTAGPVNGADLGLRLDRALGGLDTAGVQLAGAVERFAQAAELARSAADRAGQRLDLLAERNRAEAMIRLGKRAQAASILAAARARADRLSMPGLAWRIAAGPAEQRAAALLALPPVVAGTASDRSAIAEQERLLGGLVARALDAGQPERAVVWAERLLSKRRLDRIRLVDLEPITYADRSYLKGLREAQHELIEAIADVDPAAGDQGLSRAGRRVDTALSAWQAARRPPAGVRPALAGLLADRPLDTAALRGALDKGEGLLLTLALDEELIVFLATSAGWEINRQPVARAEFVAALGVLAGKDPSRAAGARSQLSAWLLQPMAKSLDGLSDLIAVTDDLSVDGLRLPLGLLVVDGRPLISRLGIAHLACASNLLAFRRLRNLNLQRGLWVGPPPDGPTSTALKAVLGTLGTGGGGAGQVTQSQAEAGVVFWNVPLSEDRRRPMRSALVLDPSLGAIGGLPLSRLAGQTTQAGLWVLASSSQAGPDPAVVGGLELTMISAQVPSGWILPDAAARPGVGRVLRRGLELTGSVSPARALAGALREALADRVPWRELIGVQLRGDGGMGLEVRKRFAKQELGTAVRQAMLAFRQKRWDSALRLFLKVRQLAVFLEQTGLLPRLDQAIVTSAFQLEEYELAAKVERRILAQAEAGGDPGAAARARNFLGVLESRLGNYPQAIEQLKTAVVELDGLGKSDDAAEAQANLALALDAASRYQESIETAKDARTRFQKIGKPDRALAMTRNVGTAFLRRLNMTSAARTWFGRALAQAEKLGQAALVGRVLLDLARTELAAGNYDEALGVVGRAEDAFGRAGELRGKAEASLERAKVHWYRGEYQRAFTAQRQVMTYAEEADDRGLRIMARSLGGLIAMNLGDLVAAEKRLGQALDEARRAGLEDEQAAQLNNLGIVARERGDLDLALERFERARRIDEKRKSVLGRAYDLRNTGIVKQMMGRLDAARADLDEALRLSRSVHERFNEVKTLAGLARLEIVAGRLDAGRQHAEQAYALAGRLGLREVAWRALRSQGEIARREGRLEQARQNYARAIDLVERMRAGLKMERFRSGFLDNKFDLYADMVHLLFELDQPEAAFAYTERSRARGFLDLLANRQIQVGSAGDRALLERVRAGKQRLAELTEAVRQFQAGQRAEAEQRADAEKELHAARQEYEQLLAKLRAQSPDLIDFVEVRPVEAAQIRARLDARVALVSYYVTDEDTLAFVIRADGVRAHRLALPRRDLTERVQTALKLIETFTPAEDELRSLYRDLVAPLETDLAGVVSVGVLAHDVLHYLPFGVLQPTRGRYWSDEVVVFSSPSASVLELLLRREEERFGPSGGVLALGNPDLGDPALALPFAEQEARAIGFEQPGAEVETGRAASEALVKDIAGSRAFVHLASHGAFDPDSPLQSAIKLAPGGGQDGDLTAMEVFSMPLSARLVSLSACQTGLGQLRSGDEIIGFNRAFLAAGAGGVLSSLWRVSDVATAVLMKRFYRNLKRYPAAEALKRAQAVVRRYYPHPAYWAGFVLTGTWR